MGQMRSMSFENTGNCATTVVNGQLGVNRTYNDSQAEQMRSVYSREPITDIRSVVMQKQRATSTSTSMKTNIVGKTRIVALISIIALMTFLLIYNVFAMASMTASIATTEQQIVVTEQQVNNLQSMLEAVSSEEAIMNRVSEAGYSSEYAVTITPEMIDSFVLPETFEGQTNWFDQVCEFISSIFGG